MHRMMSSESVKYFRDKSTNIIHDKSCRHVRKIPFAQIEPLTKYDANCATCPDCDLKAYIRSGAKDFDLYEEYLKVFDLFGIYKKTAREMYVTNGFQTKLSHMVLNGYPYAKRTYNAITIWCREDTWRLGVIQRRWVRLEHNNYRRLQKGKREFTQGFHVQSPESNLDYALRVIENYRYEDHFIEATDKPVVSEVVTKAAASPAFSIEQTKEKPFRMAIRKFRKIFRKDRLHGLQNSSDNNRPKARQLYLYEWKDDTGGLQWGTGWYNAKRKFFSASYGDNGIRVDVTRVVKWVALDQIDLL